MPMWDTSNVFKAGHRIRLHVTSSNFRRFNRNLNSGKSLWNETNEDIRVAAQIVFRDGSGPSGIAFAGHPKMKRAGDRAGGEGNPSGRSIIGAVRSSFSSFEPHGFRGQAGVSSDATTAVSRPAEQ